MKKIFIPIFMVLFLITSCENHLDVNEDPNNPSVDNINPSIILPAAQLSTARRLTTRMNQLGNCFMTNWGGNVVSYSGPFQDEFKYDLTTTFYSDIWNNLYLNTGNYSAIINYNGTENYDNHIAIAKILKSFYFQYLVDIYGDIPYSEAHLRDQNLFPKYDNAKNIYRDLITQLNEAIDLIDNVDETTVIPVGNSDIMLYGDMTKWKKFANTLKLKILMRESTLAQTNAESQTYLLQQFATLENDFLNLNENITINPGFVDSAGKQSLFYSVYGYDPNGSTPYTGQEVVVATKYAIEFLNGTINGVSDNRLGRIYKLTPSGNYFGVEQGALLASLPPGQNLSRLGTGLISDATVDSYLLTSSESLFLQAEAIEKGYLVGNSKAKFQDGIRASFNLLGATDVDTYLTNSDGANGIGWEGTVNKTQAIMTQKWIALNGINGIESWIEYNRTGFPVLPLPLTTTATDRPKRLLYPQSEISGNTANVPNQSLSDAFTTKIFWDVN